MEVRRMAVRRPTEAEQGVRPMGAEQELGLTCKPTRTGRGFRPITLAQHVPFWILNEIAKRYEGRHAHLDVNVWPSTGGRYYIDTQSHPEFATPECTSLDELVGQILAGRKVYADAAASVDTSQANGVRELILVGNDYAQTESEFLIESFGGLHENYLVENGKDNLLLHALLKYDNLTTEEEHAEAIFASQLATRVVYTGNGYLSFKDGQYTFFLSSRLPFIAHFKSAMTLRTRPLLQKRDEPHLYGDAKEHSFRWHVIAGNPNVSQVAMFLTFGTTNLLLRFAEEAPELFLKLPALADPVKALKTINADIHCDVKLLCTDGVWRTAVQLQQVYRKAIAAYILNVSGDPDYVVAQNEKVLALWDANLKQLAEDPLAIDGLRDWSLKRALFQERLTKWDVDTDEMVPKKIQRKLYYLDMLYHMVSALPESAEVRRVQERLLTPVVSEGVVKGQIAGPPGQLDFPPIRSWARGNLIELMDTHGLKITLINWEVMIIEGHSGPERTFEFSDVVPDYANYVLRCEEEIENGTFLNGKN